MFVCYLFIIMRTSTLSSVEAAPDLMWPYNNNNNYNNIQYLL